MAESSKSSNQKPLRVAIDTGGTFTDCVWMEAGRLRMTKVFSSPDDPSRAIAEALQKISRPGQVILLHGTTVGTNTVLQRKGARVALVTTSGFADVIEIGRQARPKLYDLNFQRTPPLVERSLRFEIGERVAADGEVLQWPSREELQRVARDVHASGAESIAVCTLFSFANPVNERAIGRVLEELGLPLSLSSVILPEFREYERTSTVVLNAYLQPVMQAYLQSLSTRVRHMAPPAGKNSRVFVMQSSGGITSLESAAHQPVRTLLSGPAGGVVGAASAARLSSFDRILTFDMGGTSTDVSLVMGEPQPAQEGEIDGLPVRVPMLDIHTVGAGGGSIARFDAGGALRVGPESAGADPGPICYGKGTLPTVTDANLLLGRLQADQFLGGEFVLDVERTRELTAQWLKASRSDLTLEEFAEGVVRVVNANMERALRVVSIERGHDPRDFTLVAFGGAGGLHACELALALDIPRVLLPAMPGAVSAYGILNGDVIKDYSRTVVWTMAGKPPLARLRKEYAVLEQRARSEFSEEGWTGKLILETSADLRYRGQGFELNVRFSPRVLEEFHRQHQFRYGYQRPERVVELVTLRLRARLTTRQPRISPHASKTPASPRKPEMKSVWFAGRARKTNIYPRESLAVGKTLPGPAIVAEYSATTFIPPGGRFRLDQAGNLLIELAAKKGAPESGRLVG